MVDPPRRLSSNEERIKVETRIWGASPSSVEGQQPLLDFFSSLYPA